MNALDLQGVSKIYRGKRGRKVEALTDLTLQVPVGEVFGFLGPNGAGKSTTIKTVMGQIQATSGAAHIFDSPVTDHQARQRVGYLPENPAFYDFMTAREYLRFVGRAFAMNESAIASESERVLALLELSGAADRPIRSYSKGMVQRVGIAQTLFHDPELYVLDEPMSGLDPQGRALVKKIILDLKQQGKTVFFSTHITADVEVVCDRVGVIVAGKLMAVDNVNRILAGGVDGYDIQVEHQGKIEAVFVAKDRLKSYLAQLAATDATIENIEPVRRNLEDFFLDVVARGADADKQ